MKDLVTRSKAAKMIGISVSTLKYHVFRRYLHPAPTASNRVYFHRSDVLDYKKTRAARLRKQSQRREQREKQTDKNPSNDENDNL